MTRRLDLALENGAEGSPSHRNLLRAGFPPAHRLTQWRRPTGTTLRRVGDGPVTDITGRRRSARRQGIVYG